MIFFIKPFKWRFRSVFVGGQSSPALNFSLKAKTSIMWYCIKKLCDIVSRKYHWKWMIYEEKKPHLQNICTNWPQQPLLAKFCMGGQSSPGLRFLITNLHEIHTPPETDLSCICHRGCKGFKCNYLITNLHEIHTPSVTDLSWVCHRGCYDFK